MAAPPEDFTTTALLAAIKRRAMLPSSPQTLTDSDFLTIATEESRSYIMPLLVSVNEEYGIFHKDITLVSGTDTYDISSRAAGETIRLVRISDGTGWIPLPRLEPEHIHELPVNGAPAGYYIEDDSIILVPSPTVAGTLRVSYPHRPAQLVATSAVATLSSLDAGRTVLTTTSTIPTSFVPGVQVDIINYLPGFRAEVERLTTQATTSGTTITLTTAVDAAANVLVNQYIALTGQSPVPQLPLETHPLLAQRVAVKCLEFLNAPTDQWERAFKTCEQMKEDLTKLIQPRTQGSQRYLINRNGPGFGGKNPYRWRIM